MNGFYLYVYSRAVAGSKVSGAVLNGNFLKRIVARMGCWNQLSRQRAQLSHLSDHMLSDIGLSRTDAQRESRRNLWDDPQQLPEVRVKSMCGGLVQLPDR
ncbi:MAG: DUF1127 domain-containing protein [Gammaproteobacteria bacterium]|nr:DUF1127 domain-containing protein [Gammaproteobacteria bacterium]